MFNVPASNHTWFDGNDLTFKISSTFFAPWTYLFINLPAVLAYQKGLYIYFMISSPVYPIISQVYPIRCYYNVDMIAYESMIEQDSLKPNTYELETRNIVYDINI